MQAYNELHREMGPGLKMPGEERLMTTSTMNSQVQQIAWPEFRPHPMLPGGHLQTLVAHLFPGIAFKYQAKQHIVDLDDGDQLVLHEDGPTRVADGSPNVLLIHGLAGCHLSPYMIRIAGKLAERGVRTFRMDHRGCGAGASLAKKPYHSGITQDASAALQKISQLFPNQHTLLAGFSLGGNIALKLVGERPSRPMGNLGAVLAVNPPIDLAQCVASLKTWPASHYDRYFVRLLVKSYKQRRAKHPQHPPFVRDIRPPSIEELDDIYTAPISGFKDAQDYYSKCNSAQFLSQIEIPTTILTAEDDPLVPYDMFKRAVLSPSVRLIASKYGGHLGYLSRGNGDPDRRWMDWRVVEWVMNSIVR